MGKTSREIIILTAIISVISIILINLVNYANVESLPIAHNTDWIPFYGSFIGAIISGIMGGLITLEGVKETIKYSKKASEEEDRYKIKPYLHIQINGSGGSSEKDIVEVNNIGEIRGNANDIEFSINLKNIGLESCVNIYINDTLIENSIQKGDISKTVIIKTMCYDGDESINTIPIIVIFEDLMGNVYKQEYRINFMGEFEQSKLKMIRNNTSPTYIEKRK